MKNIFLSYVIIMIDLFFDLFTAQLLKYFFDTIILSFKNSIKYSKNNFILSKNISQYFIIFLCLCPSENIPFCIFFY